MNSKKICFSFLKISPISATLVLMCCTVSVILEGQLGKMKTPKKETQSSQNREEEKQSSRKECSTRSATSVMRKNEQERSWKHWKDSGIKTYMNYKNDHKFLLKRFAYEKEVFKLLNESFFFMIFGWQNAGPGALGLEFGTRSKLEANEAEGLNTFE